MPSIKRSQQICKTLSSARLPLHLQAFWFARFNVCRDRTADCSWSVIAPDVFARPPARCGIYSENGYKESVNAECVEICEISLPEQSLFNGHADCAVCWPPVIDS